MINSVTVTNHLGDSMKMVLRNPEETGFLITNIEGIGAGQADINTTELSATDGSIFNSSRVESRNIVMSLKLLFKPTVEDVRHLSYKYFPLKKNVNLLFETDTRTLAIDGYVESNEPDIFSNSETTQISIICPNPYFYSPTYSSTVFSGVEPMFEFPFSNESLTEPLLIMGEIRIKFENYIEYYGDAETGVVMILHFLGPSTGIKIYKVDTRETMTIDTTKIPGIVGSEIKAGDDIIISTVVGDKYAQFVRNGKEYNILNCISRDSDWFKLDIGDNIIAFRADTGDTNIQFTVNNELLYVGV